MELEQIRQIPVRRILDCMTGTLGIINYDGKGGYSFIHHHIRDYFISYGSHAEQKKEKVSPSGVQELYPL